MVKFNTNFWNNYTISLQNCVSWLQRNHKNESTSNTKYCSNEFKLIIFVLHSQFFEQYLDHLISEYGRRNNFRPSWYAFFMSPLSDRMCRWKWVIQVLQTHKRFHMPFQCVNLLQPARFRVFVIIIIKPRISHLYRLN